MSVSQGETIIRPAVALLVQSAHTFTDVLQHALEFEDTHVFSEARIVDTLLSDVDVTLRNDAGEDLGVAVMTTVGDALLFGRFSSVLLLLKVVKVWQVQAGERALNNGTRRAYPQAPRAPGRKKRNGHNGCHNGRRWPRVHARTVMMGTRMRCGS